jgi:predicted nucleotidyltransferase
MEFGADNLDWNGKAGQRLDEFTRRLPPRTRLELTVFGSAPLQLFVDRSFLSEDIDLFCDNTTTDSLIHFVESNHWGKGPTDKESARGDMLMNTPR